jgi:hypothetical protein
MSLLDNYNLLIETVREIDGVLSIGKSGGENIPMQGESDIDIFIFCSKVPNANAKKTAIQKLTPAISIIQINETAGRFWGVCDFVAIDDTDVCLMYFNISDMDDEIESVLDGSRLDKESEYFYPTGRCATFMSMHILYDKTGYISGMKEKLSVYPMSLAEKSYNHHIRKINNGEDFERAVSRGDVLFYHSTLESVIDHYLQALFALNQCWFPSRKRTMQFVEGFKYKPVDFSEKLLEVIKLGAEAETLTQSYDIWSALCKELLQLSIFN